MKIKIALAALTMLAACTTISDVTPAGDGRYTSQRKSAAA
ncbi:uncharacterized protein YceK [Paraburkholderia strydomiana]|nr:uncharacterized protein YceK [Paraburkholderia strydomiana]